MKPGEWMKRDEIAKAAKVPEERGIQRILKDLVEARLIDKGGEGKSTRYCRIEEPRQ
jgi:hypothetical protein